MPNLRYLVIPGNDRAETAAFLLNSVVRAAQQINWDGRGVSKTDEVVTEYRMKMELAHTAKSTKAVLAHASLEALTLYLPYFEKTY